MRQTPVSDNGQECFDCRTVLSSHAQSCDACGGQDLRLRQRPRFPYDALAAFMGVIVVVLYWIVRS